MLGFKKIKQGLQAFKIYLLGLSGAVAISFGLMIPVVVTAVGISVDMAQIYMVRERLARAIDASALAGGASGGDEAEVENKVIDFFYANYPDERIGDPFGLSVLVDGNDISVSSYARVDMAFMYVIGTEYVDVFHETVIERQIRGLEVVLVLDNTGSMNTNDNIGALKTASENFVDILFERVSDPQHVRIGMVPYSSSVNVGPYGLGLDHNDNAYGTPFVEPPANDIYDPYGGVGWPLYNTGWYGINESDLEYDESNLAQWQGCVLAEPYPLDTEDHSGPWEMYRYDFEGSTNSWYRNIYSWPWTNGDRYNSYYRPNYHCPDQSVVPLTSDQDFLLDSINNMNADGFTLGNYGMVWGWRVLSPEEPFVEGSEWGDSQWEKAVLMMTDGVNTMNHAYTAYGRTVDHSIDPGDLNDRFAEICDAMKEENILIYTVTFFSGVDEETKDYYRECATDENKYYDAPSQDDLIEVFENISRELSNLHIKQ